MSVKQIQQENPEISLSSNMILTQVRTASGTEIVQKFWPKEGQSSDFNAGQAEFLVFYCQSMFLLDIIKYLCYRYFAAPQCWAVSTCSSNGISAGTVTLFS